MPTSSKYQIPIGDNTDTGYKLVHIALIFHSTLESKD